MKISFDWLGHFLDWKEKDPFKVADKLCVCTAEIDEVEDQAAAFEGVCVGKITKISEHPDADKLVLCDVETDKGMKRVVCGGSNLREGMHVAFAHVGTTVKWHGTDVVTLEKVKIRGEMSEGMICTAEELELTDTFPESTEAVVIDLGDGPHKIQPLSEHLSRTDFIFHVDNHAITHRADLFSHLGFAQECVALGLGTWKKDQGLLEEPAFTKDPIPFKHIVDCKEHVPRYLSCMIEIDEPGETPDWMKRRLEATGWRSLNLPVDITNYVAMEWGMPLHSFDADDLKGDVHMRLSKKGEKITTLDEEERELPDGAIVLSDDEGIFDLMGIMGGLRSSTKNTTKRIYLHSAVIDPVMIRNAILKTGHRTDASTVYEKGIPPVTAKLGLERAIQLFLELVPGAKVTSVCDSWGDEGNPEPIELSVEKTNHLLGTDIDEKRMTQILTDLGFAVESNKGTLSVTPPLWRIGDITGAHDLTEEIARIYGFNDIEPKLPDANIAPPARETRVSTIRHALAERGAYELMPLSLIGPRDLEKCHMDPEKTLKIKNPIGEELSIMQPSVLPTLLTHAERNVKHVDATLSAFTIAHVFAEDGSERSELGLLVSSRTKTNLKDDPFLLARTRVEEALNRTGYSVTPRTCKNAPAYAHPGRSAELVVEDTVVGTVFEVHPTVRSSFNLPERAAACLLDVEALLALESSTTIAVRTPDFPGITYDITVPINATKNIDTLLLSIRASSDLLEDVAVTDLYASDTASNVTLRCTYRADDRTLTDEEGKKEFAAVEKLCSQY